MANLNDICEDMLASIDHALAAAIVDQDSGLLLAAAHNMPHFTESFLDATAAAAVDLFRGKGISGVEGLLAELRGEEAKHSLREVQMSTERTYHFAVVVPDRPDVLAILVTGKPVNLGLAWAELRSRLRDIAAACP